MEFPSNQTLEYYYVSFYINFLWSFPRHVSARLGLSEGGTNAIRIQSVLIIKTEQVPALAKPVDAQRSVAMPMHPRHPRQGCRMAVQHRDQRRAGRQGVKEAGDVGIRTAYLPVFKQSIR